MATLYIRLDAQEFVAQSEELLDALEGASKLVHDEFLCRLEALLSDGAECGLLSAPGAGDHVVVLKLFVPGLAELIASARSAKQLDGIGHGGSHAK